MLSTSIAHLDYVAASETRGELNAWLDVPGSSQSGFRSGLQTLKVLRTLTLPGAPATAW